MIKLAGMARQAGRNRAQALDARQLRVQQGDELVLRGEPPHLLVGLGVLDQPIQRLPGHQLQYCVKYCIVMTHGVALLPRREHWQMLKTQKNLRHAPCPQKSNRTAVAMSQEWRKSSRRLMEALNTRSISLSMHRAASLGIE